VPTTTDTGQKPTTSGSGARQGALAALGFIIGFAPWIVYWILVGNMDFLVAVLVALGLSLVINIVTLLRREPLMALEVGTALVFLVFTVLALTVSDDVLERWLQPLGNAGLLVIVLGSIVVGKPFTLQYAQRSAPESMWHDPGFLYVCRLLAWVWVAALAFMTAVSLIPPIVDGSATIRDAGDALSIVCYWVLPFAALGLALVFTMKFPDWFGEAATPLAIDGSADVTNAGGASLEVSPPDGLADEPLAVRVTGLAPGAEVEVAAETVDLLGQRWTSHATLSAGPDGSLDLDRTAPTGGTWERADASAVVWSMQPDAGAGADLFIPCLLYTSDAADEG
jgi:hypothetical protein